MKTVYYSPWATPQYYSKQFLSYIDPVRVLDDMKSIKNSENKGDNFFSCPAFVNSVKNAYMFTSPTPADVSLDGTRIINHLPQGIPWDDQLLIYKQPSMGGAITIRFYANWIFFCEDSLQVQTTPPYLHTSDVHKHGFYVPGTYDISSWFRPLEYAFQLWPGHQEFKVEQDEPLLYANFLTDEPVKLQKFYLTEEMVNISLSCVRLKNYRREKNLFKLYDIFKASKIRDRLLKEIKNNLL